MKLDYLFHRRSEPSRMEPSFDDSGRSLVTFEDSDLVERPVSREPLQGTYYDPPERVIAVQFDPGHMSPRQFSDWAHEMYLCRRLSWDEYRVVGFPAELHPDYNRTVGVLTGRRAQPDWPRDMIREWEDRLAFARRHNEANAVEVTRASKIITLLKRGPVGELN